MQKEVYDFLAGNTEEYPLEEMCKEINALEHESGFLMEISQKVMARISGSTPTSPERMVSIAALCNEFAALVFQFGEKKDEETLKMLLENLRYMWREVD